VLVWRLCRRPFADLSGEGGRIVSGRWHNAGKPIVYTAYEPALAILEVRVNLDLAFEDLPDDYVLMGIDITDLVRSATTPVNSLTSLAETRAYGDDWLGERRTALLNVPSVLAPRGRNFLINPLHPEAKKAFVTEITDFTFDRRLWN